MASQNPPPNLHPPYQNPSTVIGGTPTVKLDVPICAVFLALYIGGAVFHMTVYQRSRRRGIKFLPSVFMFGFCMARILTCTLRIVWATKPTRVQIAIAAQVLVAAGILIVFLIDLILAQRILRATHPHIGWHKGVSILFIILYILILLMLAMVITSFVQSLYTLRPDIHLIDRDVEWAAISFILFLSFLPIPIVILSLILPRKTPVEHFGLNNRSFGLKVIILLTVSVLACLGAAFRAGTSYENPRPKTDPAWYDAKWCFYVFNFSLDILIVYMYAITRFDKLFWVPNGSKGSGDYSRGFTAEAVMGKEFH